MDDDIGRLIAANGRRLVADCPSLCHCAVLSQ
jgi:hypothetical protein